MARRDTVCKFLQDELSATTSYGATEPRRRVKIPWRAVYGWELAAVDRPGSLLDADGKATEKILIKKFSHEPGDVITTSPKRTRGEVVKYMVRPNHELRRITEK